MIKHTEDGTQTEIALFAKNPRGKSILVASDDFDVDSLTEEQKDYVIEEIGSDYELYTEEM